MTAFTTSRILRLLLLLLPLMEPTLAMPPTVADEDQQAHLSHLQRREVICNPDPNQNLNLQDCHSALQQIPGSLGIGLVLGGTDHSSPYYLPREFAHNNCRIIVQLAPELTHVLVSWASVRYRASLLVNLCVGGLGAWAPGHSNVGLVPGRGGNDTYSGVMIGVMRPWVSHNVQ